MADMSEFDRAAAEATGVKSMGNNALAKLPDGKYVAVLTKGETPTFGKGNVKVVFKFAIELSETETIHGSKEYWIIGEKGVDEGRMNEMLADLKSMGADSDAWRKGGLSGHLEKFHNACHSIQINITKSTSTKVDKNGQPYINVYLNGRAKNDDGTPKDGFPVLLDSFWVEERLAKQAENPEIPF